MVKWCRGAADLDDCDMSVIPLHSKEAFDIEKTRVICDAFDAAWAHLQEVDSDFTSPAKAPAAREALARRIIEMAQRGVVDAIDLRDDALQHLQDDRSAT
jgi:hypothetical protein